MICILAIAQKEASSEGEGIERKVPTEQEKEIPHYITFTLAQSPAWQNLKTLQIDYTMPGAHPDNAQTN